MLTKYKCKKRKRGFRDIMRLKGSCKSLYRTDQSYYLHNKQYANICSCPQILLESRSSSIYDESLRNGVGGLHVYKNLIVTAEVVAMVSTR
jgi:hypothetical protein